MCYLHSVRENLHYLGPVGGFLHTSGWSRTHDPRKNTPDPVHPELVYCGWSLETWNNQLPVRPNSGWFIKWFKGWGPGINSSQSKKFEGNTSFKLKKTFHYWESILKIYDFLMMINLNFRNGCSYLVFAKYVHFSCFTKIIIGVPIWVIEFSGWLIGSSV